MRVNYGNGSGSGKILWRLGKNGDFTMNSSDPYPWFSHQHEAAYESSGTQFLSLFDNGDTRRESFPNANSRGQLLELDEPNRTATLTVNIDLGVYGYALGSAQRLANGNYQFQPGIVNAAAPQFSYDMEVTGAGTTAFEMQGPPSYRDWRMRTLYDPPQS